jgi:hypothetical protein
MRTYIQFALVFVLLTAAGCSQQQYGQCEAPNDNLKVMYKPKVAAHPFSHSFCIVCNPDLTPEEHAAWAMEMGAPKEPGDPEDMLPCLYVYPPDGGSNANSLKQCKSWVCDGGAEYSDMVSEKNGNFDLEKLLNGEVDTSKIWQPILEQEQTFSSPMEPAQLPRRDMPIR